MPSRPLLNSALASWPTAVSILAALAVGLIVGLERGWREREEKEGGRVAGLRTFALVGMLGGVLATALPQAGGGLLVAGLIGVAIVAALGYREVVRTRGNLSATSAIALLLTYALGAMAVLGHPAVAAGSAVAVAVLLKLRPILHLGLRRMEGAELDAALQMLVLSVVVLPWLPDQAFGRFDLNPARLWWGVVVVAGLSLLGHVSMRLAGPARGLLWTGLLGGLASSTAATLALGRQSRALPALSAPAAAGALAACAVMFVRIAVVAGAFAPALLVELGVPLGVAAATLMALALAHWRRAQGAPPVDADGRSLPPFDLLTALGFGAYLAVTTVLLSLGQQHLGEAGLLALALLAGLADVDAITVSVAQMQASGVTAVDIAAMAVALAAGTNLVAKAVLARTAGSAAFARSIALGYGAAALAALASQLAASVLG